MSETRVELYKELEEKRKAYWTAREALSEPDKGDLVKEVEEARTEYLKKLKKHVQDIGRR